MERSRHPRHCAALLVLLTTRLGTGPARAAATLEVTVTDAGGAVLTGAVVALQRPPSAGETAPAAGREWVVDQLERQFLPRVVAIGRGDRVSFPNSDNVRHHVYSFSPAKVFELPLYGGEPTAPVTFEQAGKVALGETLNLMRQEISAREQRIVHQSSHDELTGLPNRYMAMDRIGDRIEQAIARAKAMHTPFTVALLDLSRFKQINDTLGHHVGDQVLRELATRLQSSGRTGYTIARLGGDDFLMVLEGADIEHSVRRMTRELDEHLSGAVALDGMQVRLDIAVGLAGYPVHGDTATALLRRTEIALYDAKDSPADIVVYEPGRDEGHIRQLAIVPICAARWATARSPSTISPRSPWRAGGPGIPRRWCAGPTRASACCAPTSSSPSSSSPATSARSRRGCSTPSPAMCVAGRRAAGRSA